MIRFWMFRAFLPVFILILALPSLGFGQKHSFQLQLGVEVLSLPRFFESRFHPNAFTSATYYNDDIHYLSPNQSRSSLIQPFAPGQYNEDKGGERRIADEIFDVNPRLYTFVMGLTWKNHKGLYGGFEMGLWGGYQREGRLNRYFILNTTDASEYQYIAEVEEANEFRALGLFIGPKIGGYFKKMRFLKITPFAEMSIRAGTYVLMREDARVSAKHYEANNGGSTTYSLTNASGNNKSANDLEDDDLDLLSKSVYTIERDFSFPLVVNSKWVIGFDFLLTEKWNARLFTGIEWHLFWIQNLKTKIQRDATFYNDGVVGVLTEGGNTSKSLDLEEEGFFISRVSPILGLDFLYQF